MAEQEAGEGTSQETETPDTQAGQAVYTPRMLSAYDAFVLGLTNQFIWKCPSRYLAQHYDQHVSGNHLDVGVGTGYFLDRCAFPSASPRIVLFDLNASSLQAAAGRIRRYRPVTHQGDVMQPNTLEPESFDSIGLNFLLHCLPGTIGAKAVVFDNLKPLLRPGGTLFGSTVLNGGVRHGPVSRGLMGFYNRRGIFGNLDDDLDGLQQALAARFDGAEVRVIGRVALFSATKEPAGQPT